MRRLPLDRGLVVFEANMGRIYGDSPKYVYEAMRRTRPDIKAVWVLPEGHPAPAPDVDVVRRGRAYMNALARAAYWVDNQTFPGYVRKRPGQRYLQTWHGIPLKKMGRDEPGTSRPTAARPGRRRVGRARGAHPYFEASSCPRSTTARGWCATARRATTPWSTVP